MKPQMMLPRDLQESNEYHYAKKHIDGYLHDHVRGQYGNVINEGVALINDWLKQEFYDSKQKAVDKLKLLDIPKLVEDILVGSLYCQSPQPFATVSSMLALKLGFAERRDSITVIASMIAVLCDTDFYDIDRPSQHASVVITSRVRLPEALIDAVERSQYILPMVCQPEDITHNGESPYLTLNESQILGKGNNHTGNICLDVINIQNSIPLKLDIAFLSSVEELPSSELTQLDQIKLWEEFKRQSVLTYQTLIRQGNQFWLTNKVDKRGRLYAAGYHVTSQGSPYKKAMLDLADGEVVQGVPQDATALV